MSISVGDPVTLSYPVPTGERGESGRLLSKEERRQGTVLAVGGPAALVRLKDPPTFHEGDELIGGGSAPVKHDRVVRHKDALLLDHTRTAHR
mgnify:CR=1 FL=1